MVLVHLFTEFRLQSSRLHLYFLKCVLIECRCQIDFNAVGEVANLKPPAARMRYTRLRRQIEGGTLMGTHGTPFSRPLEKLSDHLGKRKRLERNNNEQGSLVEHSNSCAAKVVGDIEPDNSKSEQFETDSFESDDSGDDVPLAKRRAAVLRTRALKPQTCSETDDVPEGSVAGAQRLYETSQSAAQESSFGIPFLSPERDRVSISTDNEELDLGLSNLQRTLGTYCLPG